MHHLSLLWMMNRQTTLLQTYQELSTRSNDISRWTYLRFFMPHLFLAHQTPTNARAKLQNQTSVVIPFVSPKTIIILLINARNYILNFDLLLDGQELSLRTSKSKGTQHLRMSKMRHLSSISVDYQRS